jgi:transposase InsO family protein
MPWEARPIVSLRKDFVLRALAKQLPFAALCRQYGISRKTGYKWLRRFEATGIGGLADESRRPLISPLETSTEIQLEIIKLRQKHPTWGARKLARVLHRVHPEKAPSQSTIERVLERAKLLRKRRYRPLPKFSATQAPRVIVEEPNDLWTVDFKGWWRTADGARCEPLTVRDAFSRCVLELRILPDTGTDGVRRVFEQLFSRYGLPKAIQSDNGQPFASTRALGGLTKLSAWWVSRGIALVRSRPGCPQDNGGHERMHGDIRAEIQCAAASSLAAQQRVCDDWRAEFNHVRPHEALGMKTPSEVYRPSPRRPRPFGGGFPDRCALRKVDRRGCARFDAQTVYVTTALVGFDVAMRPLADHVEVWFYEMLLGRFAYGTGRTSVEPIPSPGNTQTSAELPPGDSLVAPALTPSPVADGNCDQAVARTGSEWVTSEVTMSPVGAVTEKSLTD